MIDLKNVVSVYSGVRGKCMCGCKGKHTYASAYKQYATDRRGYEVTDDEVNDKTVKRIVNKLNKDRNTKHEDGLYYLDVGNRSYVVYLYADEMK